jgi:hypothetical protein
MNPFPLPNTYRIFLLTVWRDEGSAAEGAVLRFSLDDPRSGQRRGFGEPAGLLAYLAACLDAGDAANPADPGD